MTLLFLFQIPSKSQYQWIKLDIFLDFKLVSSLLLCLDKFMYSLFVETISFFSMFSSNPLFSCIVTFCTLIFLYLPHLFSKIVLSPVITLTGILLLTILRLGAIQKSHHEQNETQNKHESIVEEENRASKCRDKEEGKKEKQSSPCSVESNEIEVNSEMGFESSSCFVEWNVRAPLEVIYEEYEGEEKCDDSNEKEENSDMGISNYSSLSRYYPESDSDSSSEGGSPAIEDWDSPDEWDEEDREGLIEIALDGSNVMMKKKEMEFQYEEENLIEIDISPTRYRGFSGDNETLNTVRSAANNVL